MKLAHVLFTKEVEEDNYFEGCNGKRRLIYDEKLHIQFKDTNDFKNKLADIVTTYFDIDKQDFLEYVENEIENNSFDFSQSEDGEGERWAITEEHPNGYYASYNFFVLDVYEKIEYTF